MMLWMFIDTLMSIDVPCWLLLMLNSPCTTIIQLMCSRLELFVICRKAFTKALLTGCMSTSQGPCWLVWFGSMCHEGNLFVQNLQEVLWLSQLEYSYGNSQLDIARCRYVDVVALVNLVYFTSWEDKLSSWKWRSLLKNYGAHHASCNSSTYHLWGSLATIAPLPALRFCPSNASRAIYQALRSHRAQSVAL